ncbi:hypothetical protein DFJ58DRAFT_847700 [Suillus subalutaceus]|uniref:uncharacterized protein n=1 Tax=Suillus subalutaceus TaxID=48586 RepID=UPI001B86A976|nr:uncharacterized protein DFJ58DRAFT_847700 [Suillus subalutaceus]KAG1834018.1 hypothetical protein DFJ58DRAFT_847700 [Suillus subalutaceus]
MTRTRRTRKTRVAPSARHKGRKKTRTPRRKIITEVPAHAVCRGTRAQSREHVRACLLEMERVELEEMERVEPEEIESVKLEEIEEESERLWFALLEKHVELLEMGKINANNPTAASNNIHDDEDLSMSWEDETDLAGEILAVQDRMAHLKNCLGQLSVMHRNSIGRLCLAETLVIEEKRVITVEEHKIAEMKRELAEKEAELKELKKIGWMTTTETRG